MIRAGDWSKVGDGEFDVYSCEYFDGVGNATYIKIYFITPLELEIYERGRSPMKVVRFTMSKTMNSASMM